MTALTTVLEAFTRGALGEAAACFAQDGIYREAHRAPIHGHDAIAAHFASFAGSGVAWRFTVDDVMIDGNRACVVYRFAMPEGEGKPWRERAGCATIRIDERGLIAEWREYEG